MGVEFGESGRGNGNEGPSGQRGNLHKPVSSNKRGRRDATIAADLKIEFAEEFTQQQREALTQYVLDSTRLQREQWNQVREGIKVLQQSLVTISGQTRPFERFYNEEVDTPHAESFLAQLMTCADVERDGARRQADIAREVVQRFQSQGFLNPSLVESYYLLAFCLYRWWNFARGYIFEVSLFRDLEQSNIVFAAHDLSQPGERYSDGDLVVLGLKGDIKRSLYFLDDLYRTPLAHDFYLTRLFHPQTRQPSLVAVMTERAWREIDGETVVVPMETVAQNLPGVVQTGVQGITLFIADYERFKNLVRAKQSSQFGGESNA
jgi:hypothetical protein